MNDSVQRAIEDRLAYLEDNRERYVRCGGYPVSHPIVREYDREIAELREASEKK